MSNFSRLNRKHPFIVEIWVECTDPIFFKTFAFALHSAKKIWPKVSAALICKWPSGFALDCNKIFSYDFVMLILANCDKASLARQIIISATWVMGHVRLQIITSLKRCKALDISDSGVITSSIHWRWFFYCLLYLGLPCEAVLIPVSVDYILRTPLGVQSPGCWKWSQIAHFLTRPF